MSRRRTRCSTPILCSSRRRAGFSADSGLPVYKDGANLPA